MVQRSKSKKTVVPLETLKPRNLGTLEPWNLGTKNKIKIAASY
jgi:hypothetical protein